MKLARLLAFCSVALLILILTFPFAGCNKSSVEEPEVTSLDTLLEPDESVLYIPVKYSVQEVEDLLNQKLKGTFIKKWMVINDNNDSLYLEISKTRNISISRKGYTVLLDIPLKISGKFIAHVAGLKVKNSSPVDGIINLKLASELHLDKNWNLLSKSRIIDIKWVKEPDLKIGPVKVHLGKVLLKVLDDKEESVLGKADKALSDLLNLRKIVTKLWMDIQKPIRINKKKMDVYLKAYGTDLAAKLEDTDPDMVSIGFELKAKIQTLLQGDSIPASNENLPPFKQIKSDEHKFEMYIWSSIPFNRINTILNAEVTGKEIKNSGLSTIITGLDIYGTETGIAVKMKVKGDVDGTFYVTGTPAFDTLTNELRIKDFEFSIESQNLLANSADWLLHSEVLSLLNDKLVFRAGNLISNLPSIIHNAVEKGKSGNKIDISIENLDVTPLQIITTKKDIQIVIKGIGKAAVELEDKVFEKKKKAA